MGKIKNYNYAFVLYDVNQKRVHKVFKVCKRYLNHYQKSIFRGDITTSKLIALKSELNEIIDPTEDFISIVKLMNKASFGEEILGTPQKDGDSMFI